MNRRIGALTPVWNQELFIKPHYDMLTEAGLDRYVVLMQKGPLPNYQKEHGYGIYPDLSRQIIEEYFPQVEIYEGNYPTTIEFSGGLYNEGLEMMEDCDIVLRLDPDMFWTKKDFTAFIDYIRKTDFDCYRMDFRKNSINYYMTGDFNHGLKDAQEVDPLGVNPHFKFTGVLDYKVPIPKQKVIDIPDWMCHHFRGWQKPKSTPSGWDKMVSKEYIMEFGNRDKWFSCPDEIKEPIQKWLDELEILKDNEYIM